MSLLTLQNLTATFVLFSSIALAAPANAVTIKGTVVSANGSPVEGAEVIAATLAKAAFPNVLPEDRDDARRGAGTTLSDASGHFSLEAPEEPGLLSINHPKAGYAEVKPQALGEDAKIKLEPWCRIEGVVKVGAKPAPAGTKISLGTYGSVARSARVHYSYDVTTDDQGRYFFDRVPAGLNQLRVKTSPTASTLELHVAAVPDKPLKFDIGGKGRPITGKLTLPSGFDVKDLNNPDPNAKLLSNSHLRRTVPWPKRPPVDGSLPDQDQEDAAREWRKTPEAIEQFTNQYRCTVEFQPDGSFRFDDVPPGKYVLTLTIYQRSGNLIGVIRPEVVVPETPAAPTDVPLDLGSLSFEDSGKPLEGL